MNLKSIVNAIKKADNIRAELDNIEKEKEELTRQYLLIKDYLKAKSEGEYKKINELHNCSHPLIIMYDYLGFEFSCFNRECVCCGYSLDHSHILENEKTLRIELTLQDDEPATIEKIIRQRLVQIFEANPNLSLDEAKGIIATELPEIQRLTQEERDRKNGINRKYPIKKRIKLNSNNKNTRNKL